MGGGGRPSGDTPDAERDANVCVPLSVYTPPCRAKNARRGWGTRIVCAAMNGYLVFRKARSPSCAATPYGLLGGVSGLEEDLQSEFGIERLAGTDRGVAKIGPNRGADGSTFSCPWQTYWSQVRAVEEIVDIHLELSADRVGAFDDRRRLDDREIERSIARVIVLSTACRGVGSGGAIDKCIGFSRNA